MNMHNKDAYTRARIIACKGRKVSIKTPGNRWEIVFVPLDKGRCHEIGLSSSGEISSGFVWIWDGEENFTIEAEDNENEKGTKGKNQKFLD